MSKFEVKEDPFADAPGYVLVDEGGDPVAAVITFEGLHRAYDPETGRPITWGLIFDAVKILEGSGADDVTGMVVSVGAPR